MAADTGARAGIPKRRGGRRAGGGGAGGALTVVARGARVARAGAVAVEGRPALGAPAAMLTAVGRTPERRAGRVSV